LTMVLLTFSTVKTEEGKTVFLTLVLLPSFLKTRRRRHTSAALVIATLNAIRTKKQTETNIVKVIKY
jgi:hypothetical protein